MTDQRHTPEPWENVDGRWIGQRTTKDHIAVLDEFGPWEANGERIVSCVNALAGIPDPETAVPALVEACLDAQRLLRLFLSDDACDPHLGMIDRTYHRARAALRLAGKGE